MLHFAYLDAGTGSLFIQAILGAVLAGGFVIRGTIRRTLARVKQTLSRENVSDEEV